MPVLKLLGGLRCFGAEEQYVSGSTVAAVLDHGPVPHAILFPNGALNQDVEVLVNGRNIAFLDGLNAPLAEEDRVTIFVHGARGYPGG
jgi:molybdopterin converting factor small subunit